MNDHPFPPFWFIFDVESIGLHGDAFAVAAQVFDHNADPIPGREGWWHGVIPHYMKGSLEDHQWVEKNVPILVPNYRTMREVRGHFWDEWEDTRKEFPGIAIAAECSWPVEAKFLSEVVADDPKERTWGNGIYPLHDIASIMLSAGMDPMATYARAHDGIDLYPPHHPLGDVKHSAWCLHAALKRLREGKAQ